MRISGKQLATGVAVALACALGTFSLAGCSGAKSPIHDEIEVAKADIASDVPSEIIEGWSFLAQNKDDSEAKRAIEELGGHPHAVCEPVPALAHGGQGEDDPTPGG